MAICPYEGCDNRLIYPENPCSECGGEIVWIDDPETDGKIPYKPGGPKKPVGD